MMNSHEVSYDDFNRLYAGFAKSKTSHLPTAEEKKYMSMDIDSLVDKLKRSCE